MVDIDMDGHLINNVLQVWLAVLFASMMMFSATLFILRGDAAVKTLTKYVSVLTLNAKRTKPAVLFYERP